MIIESTQIQGGYILTHYEIPDHITLPINWKTMQTEARLEWVTANATDKYEFARKVDPWYTTDVFQLPDPTKGAS
jgi:hypothetical protein